MLKFKRLIKNIRTFERCSSLTEIGASSCMMADNSVYRPHNFLQTRLWSTVTSKPSKTAGIIVIGDEILKGQVTDTNAAFSSKLLFDLGIRLQKISIIGDDLKQISTEVKNFSRNFDYVITSGGIGPTHDDLTYEGVAKAFGEVLILNPIIRDICFKYFHTDDLNCPGMKLAWIPKSAKLILKPNLKFPFITVKNVYLFPGIPQLFELIFKSIVPTAFESPGKFYCKTVYFNVGEQNIVTALNKLIKIYKDVEVGSYPKFDHDFYKVKVVLQSMNEEKTNQAFRTLLELVPAECIVNYK